MELGLGIGTQWDLGFGEDLGSQTLSTTSFPQRDAVKHASVLWPDSQRVIPKILRISMVSHTGILMR